jgi:hypothetical protein
MSRVRMDIDARFSVTKALGPVNITSNTNTDSAAIDISAFPGWKVMVIVSTGTRTDGTYTPSVLQSATSGGSYSAITPVNGDVSGIGAADTTRKASYRPTQNFLKVRVASTSVTTGGLVTAFILLVPPTS